MTFRKFFHKVERDSAEYSKADRESAQQRGKFRTVGKIQSRSHRTDGIHKARSLRLSANEIVSDVILYFFDYLNKMRIIEEDR